MPNHWHLVVWPRNDGELSKFVGWLTLTHTQRWHAHRRSTGSGHVYQGRFKSFPVQEDEHFYNVARYVERNAARAGLVRGPSSGNGAAYIDGCAGSADAKALLAAWPLARKAGWVDHVNEPLTESELKAVQHSIQRGCPLGDPTWRDRAVRRLGLESTLPASRPTQKV